MIRFLTLSRIRHLGKCPESMGCRSIGQFKIACCRRRSAAGRNTYDRVYFCPAGRNRAASALCWNPHQGKTDNIQEHSIDDETQHLNSSHYTSGGPDRARCSGPLFRQGRYGGPFIGGHPYRDPVAAGAGRLLAGTDQACANTRRHSFFHGVGPLGAQHIFFAVSITVI